MSTNNLNVFRTPYLNETSLENRFYIIYSGFPPLNAQDFMKYVINHTSMTGIDFWDFSGSVLEQQWLFIDGNWKQTKG